MTKLTRFSDAYATMTVALYEPLALRWYSVWSLYLAAGTMASRVARVRDLKPDLTLPTALNISVGRPARPVPAVDLKLRGTTPPLPAASDALDRPLAAGTVKPATVNRFPDASLVGHQVYPYGLVDVVAGQKDGEVAVGSPFLPLKAIPAYLNRSGRAVAGGFAFAQTRDQLFARMTAAVKSAGSSGGASLADALRDAVKDLGGVPAFDFWPVQRIEEALAPVGVMHLYRQLYFNGEEGVGPIEQAFTIAPLETLEVVYQNTRRLIHEEMVETGTEIVRETETETKNLEELSDKVSSMMQRDAAVSIAAEASGTVGVWAATVSGNADFSISSQLAREESARRLKEVTKRASERITKSITVKTRDLEETETVNLTRRVIKNESDTPVSFGLRRVLRRVRVKVQDLGPRLVWQVYVRNPGDGLARSRFVHFREAEAIAVPEVPPGVPPRPMGGTETGQTSAVIGFDTQRQLHFVSLVVQAGADREIRTLSIDSITDLEGGRLFDDAPAPRNDQQWGEHWDPQSHIFTVNIAVDRGDSTGVSLTYTYRWEPSRAVLDAWEEQRRQAVEEATQDALNEQFEREKALITERSRVIPRPAADLRREERYETMSRLISEIFGGGDGTTEPSPLEIEWFNRYFDVESAFLHTHPSWWRPRYRSGGTGLDRPAYEITADSEPAPMGSSLGWLLQLDGDDRRNEFINSPWVRACLPIRPGQEEAALDWLARHVEGTFGYNAEPLKKLLDTVRQVRENEKALGQNGADYVTIDSTVGAPAGPLKPEAVYPVIDEFQVSVPTDGFVYDKLNVVID